MAWIESHQSLGGHPKLKKLARLLGINRAQAAGHLQFLWWWALDYAQDGDISGYSQEDIAEAADWTGEPEAFVDALTTCGKEGQPGFIEHIEPGKLVIHDWYDYAGKLIEQRQVERERSKARRKQTNAVHTPDARQTTTGRPPDDRQTTAGTVPTVPNQPTKPTVPNQPERPRARTQPAKATTKTVPKQKITEHVTLSDKEHDSLLVKHGPEDTKRLIEILDNYKAANGKDYKSDYHAILNWCEKRLDEEKGKPPPAAPGNKRIPRGFASIMEVPD